jgi:acetyl esterase/lipase
LYKFLATTCAIFALVTASPLPANAQTYVIPFSEIRQAIESSGDSPDAVIRAQLAALIRSELDALGFDVNSGMVFADIPVEAMTEIIETGCNFPRPYEVHTDATTATVTIDDSSGLTLNLDSLQTINLLADLTGAVTTQATAWVRWGQDIPFGKDCAKINTDHGTVGIALPFDINLDLALQLNPSYDSELIAIVVDKHAMLQGTAIIGNGQLQHDFGGLSITDVVLDIFESELLLALQTNGEQAVADAITDLNYRLDGLDSNGQPDPTLTVFNSPTTFILDVSAQDQAFVKDLLAQYGIPDIVIAMLEERGVEVLIQLAVLEGAEREAYLASLGATITCDVTLAAFQTQLDSVPLYTLNNDVCEVTSLSGPAADSYYTDALCTDAVAYRVRDDAEFCLAYFDDQAETILGNAAAWEADNDQVNDALPAVPSRAWTTVASTQLDLGVASMSGNLLPYMKQVNYKTIDGISRGTGRCELEMRVYKNDIAEQNLRPLLALHGGTWRHRGSSFLGMEAGISHLTERGFIVFAPFYRLAGASDGNTECNDVSWREIVADAESALDWVQANGASLGAINEPVSVYGQSAGAHLSAWLASHRPNDVRKALLFYAPTDALAFLEGAVPLGGPYDAFRDFGLNSLSRLFGARGGSAELHLEYIDFADVTAEALREKWETLIPATVFDLSQVDPLNPPVYVERCATMTETDLALINPAMPPEELTNCLKEDLRDFLIDNSFNHLLSDEAVPVHVVQGTADTLVPYEQALDLCGAIDGSVLPTTVTDPLTTYDCGTHSQVQLIQDAGHALELGVCLDSLCPAGPFGGEIRNAVETAINAAYAWLMQDASQPPPPPPPPVEEEEDRGGLGGTGWWSLLGLLMICWRRRSHQEQPANQAFFRSRSRTRGFSVASWFA